MIVITNQMLSDVTTVENIIIITNSYNANILVSTLSTGAGNLHRYDANFIYKCSDAAKTRLRFYYNHGN